MKLIASQYLVKHKVVLFSIFSNFLESSSFLIQQWDMPTVCWAGICRSEYVSVIMV